MRKIRKIKFWGNSHVIVLNSTDMKDFGFKEGDLVDISNIKKEEDEE